MSFDIITKIEEWRSQLLDTSKRNRLINLSLGRAGAIKLVHPLVDRVWGRLVAESRAMSFPLKLDLVGESDEPIESDPPSGTYPMLFTLEAEAKDASERIDLGRCLESFRLHEGHLLTELTDKQLTSRLGRLALNAKTSMSEQGVPTLYVAFGLLRWYESPDSQVEILSPLLLFPAELERENIESPWALSVEEEVSPNHSLAQLMSDDFAVRLPDLPDVEGIDDPEWRGRYYAEFRRAIRNMKGWEVRDEVALGIFSFQKIAMWDDLGRNREQIAAHDLCRAIAGDPSARIAVPEGLPKARELDAVTHPAQTFHILDSDSSQHEAIEAARRGASLVLDGPPGTGKSQTIANIIAEFLAQGKTVLFVSEKSAALEVVKRRLDKRGLGDFCLECHSHRANKKQVIDELGRCLSLPPETYKDHDDDLRRLDEARQSLNDYVRALHKTRQPLGLSAFQVHGQLAAIKAGCITRCPIPDITLIDSERRRRLSDLLSALPDFRNVVENCAAHPWRGSRKRRYSLNLRDDIEHHLGRLAPGLVELCDVAPRLGRLGFMPEQPAIPDWLEGLGLAQEAPSYPLVPAEWFTGNPRQVAIGYIQLDRATRDYRQVRDELPEFSEPSAIQLDPESIRSFGCLIDGGETALLRHNKVTVLTLRDHLRSVAGSLRELARHLGATIEALDRVLVILGLTPRPLAARGLGKVQELLGLIEKVLPVRGAWLDPQKRQEIRKVVDRCREDESRNAEARLKLLDRALPRAFDPEHSRLVSRSLGYRSRWMRLLPGWWLLRGRLAGLYAGVVPETPVLLKDMSELDEYHRRLEYVRQVKQQYTDQLVLRQDGEADWERTDEGLRAAEMFDPLIRVFPELKDILVDQGRVDRDVLKAGLDDLAHRYQHFCEAVPLAGQHFDLVSVLGTEGKRSKLSATDFAGWLGGELTKLEVCLAALDRLGLLIAPGRDVPLDELPARLKSLEALWQSGAQVIRIATQLGLPLTEANSIQDRDWGDLRAKAEWTLGFLDKFGDRPPEPLVQAATRPELRQEVEEAVRRNLAVQSPDFVESWEYLAELFDPQQNVSTGIVIGLASIPTLLE
jgi:hypothetical protein